MKKNPKPEKGLKSDERGTVSLRRSSRFLKGAQDILNTFLPIHSIPLAKITSFTLEYWEEGSWQGSSVIKASWIHLEDAAQSPQVAIPFYRSAHSPGLASEYVVISVQISSK